MGNVNAGSVKFPGHRRFSLRLYRSSDSIDSRKSKRNKSKLNGKTNPVYTSQDELDGDVKMVHKMYKDQHSKKALETELQATRERLTNALDQLDHTKAELESVVKELDDLRCELDNVKRDLNREISMFATGFKQLSTAVESLTTMPKNNKVAKNSAKWRVRLDCQCIEMTSIRTAKITVKMVNFSILRKNYEWFNHYFYSHENGYKLCLRVFPSGYKDARETSMSVFIQHMDGPNDDILQWPMKGTVMVELLNQAKDKHHLVTSISYNDNIDQMCAGQVTSHETNGMGEPHFVRHDELYKTTTKKQFLRNDCLYFRISFRL